MKTSPHICLPYKLSEGITPIITPEITVVPNEQCLTGSDGTVSGLHLKKDDDVNFEKDHIVYESEIPQIIENLEKIKDLVSRQVDTKKGGWTEKQLPHVGTIMEEALMNKIVNKVFKEIGDNTANFLMVNDVLSKENEEEIQGWIDVLKKGATKK